MRRNKARDTGPEMKLRRILHKRGLRYRVGIRPVPGLRRTADVVFTKVRLAVLVDGCYWHGCPEHYRASRANEEFWRTKIEDNRRRDQETNAALDEAGWTVLRVWEHEDSQAVAERIVRMVEAASGPPRARAT
ncbi:very short patch repair endonuclease [Actinosynnema sp. NPDC053489]|uniref:very short patch repair endonuclease n=1 Tax=Actinosynnema sp. NPDC053489 TaxID=3363916 RepID=UPI0037C97F59